MKYLTLLALLLVSAPVFQLHAAGDCTAIDDSGRSSSATVTSTPPEGEAPEGTQR